MTTDDNKALVQQFFEQVINQRNVAALDQFVPPGGGVNHTVPAGLPQQGKQLLGLYLGAFPDGQVTVEDLLADGDKVVARISIRGTHQGAFRGIAPTGKQITLLGMHMFRIANGKLVEHWGLTDRLAVLQQVGVAPPLAPMS
jgi:predicted ester cyclase